MTRLSSEARARRPRAYEGLATELMREGGFVHYRDTLLFAAAVGFGQDRRVAFSEAAGDPIRYDTLTALPFADTIVSMIAASVVENDPEIMDISRLQERVTIFEEYANGGFEYIQELVNTRRQPAALIVADLVTNELAGDVSPVEIAIEDLLDGVTW